MSDRTLRLFILGDNSSADSAALKTAAIYDETGERIAKSGTMAGEKFSAGIDSGTSKLGSVFEKAGNSLGNFGLPFSSNLTKIGKDLDNVETKGKGVMEAFSAVGGVAVAALVGIAAESVHLSDEFDKSQSSLETAVKNSGGSWDALTPKITAAESAGAKFGLTSTNVAGGLATLTTATNSPTKALSELNLAENISVMRHESLSDASSQLAKILGGNTRILAQWGINLDVTSSKLHSIQGAEESLQKAHLALNTIQAEMASGQKTGASASGALGAAQLAVKDDTLNLTQAQNSQATIMAVLNQRTKDAGAIYGKTLPGEIAIAKSGIEDFGIAVGSDLTPKIHDLEDVLGDTVGFFEKNRGAATVLGAVIGGPLAAAVAVFTANRLVSMGKGLLGVADSFGTLATTALTKLGIVNAAGTASAANQEAVEGTIVSAQRQIGATQVAVSDETITSLVTQAREWDTFAAQVAVESAQVVASTGQIDEALATMAADAKAQSAIFMSSLELMGVSAKEAASAVGVAEGEIVADTDAAATGITTALGSTGVGLVIIGVGVAATEMMTHWQTVMNAMTIAADKADDGIAAALNGIVRAYNDTIGKIAGQTALHFNGPNSEAQKNFSVNTKTTTEQLPSGTSSGQAAAIQKQINQGIPAQNAIQNILDTQKGASDNMSPSKPKAPVPGSTIPSLGATPGVSTAGGAANTSLTTAEVALENKAIMLGTSLKTVSAGGTSLSQQGKTVSNLQAGTSSDTKAALDKLTSELVATHNATLTKLSGTLETDWATATAKLTTIIDGDVKSGQSLVASLTNATTSDSLDSLKESVDAIHTTEMTQLVNELSAIHTKAATDERNAVVSAFQSALTQLTEQENVLETEAQADLLNKQSAALSAQTTAIQDAAATQTAIVAATATEEADAINAAAAQISDAAKVASDIAAGQLQGITDQTQAMNDNSAAQVQAINDASQIQVDTLNEKGLFGLQLVAQQDKVALDIQTQTDHQLEAAAVQHLDSVTAQENQKTSALQVQADQLQQTDAAMIAADQAAVDAAALQGLQSNGIAESQLDAINIVGAINNAVAQMTIDGAQYSATIVQQTAQGTSQLVQATGTNATTIAAANYQGVENTTDAINAGVQSTLTTDTANATRAEAIANAALTAQQSSAQQIIANATAGLDAVTNAANQIEAKDNAIYQVAVAQANTQFAGGGTVVNLYGVPADNAAAIGNAVDWAVRTATPTPIGS